MEKKQAYGGGGRVKANEMWGAILSGEEKSWEDEAEVGSRGLYKVGGRTWK